MRLIFVRERSSNGIAYGIDPWGSKLARQSDNTESKEKISNFLDKMELSEIGRDVA